MFVVSVFGLPGFLEGAVVALTLGMLAIIRDEAVLGD